MPMLRRAAAVLALVLAARAVDAADAAGAANADGWRPEAWVPAGWVLEQAATGDLDGDGRDDLVLVLQGDDPARRASGAIGQAATDADYNPRRLIIVRGGEGGPARVLVDSDRLLPGRNGVGDGCASRDVESVAVRERRLRLALRLEHACGSGAGGEARFTFRLQGDRFRLIGLDWSYASREHTTTVSINHLSGQRLSTVDRPQDARPSTRRSVLPPQARLPALGDRPLLDELAAAGWPGVDQARR